MSDKKVSYVRTGSDNHIIAQDTTTHHKDGCSTTVHQPAESDGLGGANAHEITGITENRSDGTSKHKSK